MAKKCNKKTIMAVVDRFEDEKAVLLIGENERQVVFPTADLPEGLSEGDYLRMDISYDENATKKALDESVRLLEELRRRRL